MYSPASTKDPVAVQVEVQAAYQAMFPEGDSSFIPRVFGWAVECFTGRYGDYQAVDARYHDLEHTLQGTLCMARLLRGRHFAEAAPRLTETVAQLGFAAILMHDTGYLKKRDDTEGTGAKYTVTHVHRSAEFAACLLRGKGFHEGKIRAVQNMINCTGLETVPGEIPFESESERIAGFALGTSDLLGQMAAADYVDKLPILYSEFAEAARESRTRKHFITKFSSAQQLMENTPVFWEDYVLKKLDHDFMGLRRFLNDPFPDGPNQYVERIEANMVRLKRSLKTADAVGNG